MRGGATLSSLARSTARRQHVRESMRIKAAKNEKRLLDVFKTKPEAPCKRAPSDARSQEEEQQLHGAGRVANGRTSRRAVKPSFPDATLTTRVSAEETRASRRNISGALVVVQPRARSRERGCAPRVRLFGERTGARGATAALPPLPRCGGSAVHGRTAGRRGRKGALDRQAQRGPQFHKVFPWARGQVFRGPGKLYCVSLHITIALDEPNRSPRLIALIRSLLRT